MSQRGGSGPGVHPPGFATDTSTTVLRGNRVTYIHYWVWMQNANVRSPHGIIRGVYRSNSTSILRLWRSSILFDCKCLHIINMTYWFERVPISNNCFVGLRWRQWRRWHFRPFTENRMWIVIIFYRRSERGRCAYII